MKWVSRQEMGGQAEPRLPRTAMARSAALCFLVLILPWVALGAGEADAGKPADIYFGFAVTENSLNHYGDNLLFLDFQENVDTDDISDRVVISPRIKPGSIRLDGNAGDWNPTYYTTVHGRVMNNYPLGRHYDAVANDIRVGSVYDNQYIYFMVQFEDANHDASLNRSRWVFDGRNWKRLAHVKPRKGAPVNRGANAKQPVRGWESEDHIFFMFPIMDRQRNFRPNALGCAMYCHPNLKHSGDPKKTMMGAGVAGMHTIVPGDMADLWRWQSSSTLPVNSLEDGHLVYGEGPGFHGRRNDHGEGPVLTNDAVLLKTGKKRGPVFVHLLDLLAGNYGKRNHAVLDLPINMIAPIEKGMKFSPGVSLPYSVSRQPAGSRGDVTAVGAFDPKTFLWTVEFRRARNTGDATDHQFVPGRDQPPPENPIAIRGETARGALLYVNRGCDTCHDDNGEGEFEAGIWIIPSIQRASGALISKTVKFNQEMRGRVATLIRSEIRRKTQLIMPDIDITEQEAEDIATWLQTQYTPPGK